MKPNFFRHYENESRKIHITKIMETFGADGYALYYYLNERLFSSDEHKIHLTKIYVKGLSKTLKISAFRVHKFIKYAVDIGVFLLENEYLSSSRVDKEIQYISYAHEQKRMQTQAAGRASAEARRLRRVQGTDEVAV